MEDTLAWLLEPDIHNPGVRYFALRDLLDLPEDHPEVMQARTEIMSSGPVPVILSQQDEAGYWVQPQPNYYPKYTGTAWQVIFLAQFGADGRHPRVHQACEYVLAHMCSPYGGLSMDGHNSGLIHCLQGNLCAALIDLGWMDEARVKEAIDWLARSITGEGIAPADQRDKDIHYYRSGNSAPGFACSANNHLPCAWGAVKAILALSKVPLQSRTTSIQCALDQGVEFLFSVDPATAMYPMGYSNKPNRSWFQFGYPIAYVTDVLQNLEVLTSLGYGNDPRLANAIELVIRKRDPQGRWSMEYTYNGKTWVDIEEKWKPSKWVTFRALRVLKRAGHFQAVA